MKMIPFLFQEVTEEAMAAEDMETSEKGSFEEFSEAEDLSIVSGSNCVCPF